MDVAFSEMVVNVFFQGEGFSRSKVVNATFFHSRIRFQINGMVPRLMLWKMLGGLFTKDRFVFLELGKDSLKGRALMGFVCQGCGMCSFWL